MIKLIIKTLAVTGVLFSFMDNEASAAILSTHAKNSQETYNVSSHSYTPYMTNYSVTGDYLNYSKKNLEEGGRVSYDKNGIPMIFYYGKPFYNPVTLSNLALAEHGRYLRNWDVNTRKNFLKYADTLISMQSKDGSFRYAFPFKKPEYNYNYKPGWVSAMPQGEALSVYSRAYRLTNDKKYLEAGKRSLEFLQVSKTNGGVMTDLGDISSKWKDYIWFEEYVTPKNNYTLNGYMFVLLGLYDWSKLEVQGDYGQQQANSLFNRGIQSLKKVLPKYDMGGFTMYDLSYYTMKTKKPHVAIGYHAVHIYQLKALYSITNEPSLLSRSNLWASYVKK
ncbi:D-glucuronyl C5-epimerase family protein [Neobacillus sp. YIM B06451]|uniref:D-glucuronyl C5-epimerase family protein n=1 Tax=Neobacillus sp. YIM B06451 TaxID=3070994 RepID=UPI00292E3526|nr:D-glucuronyl C5-epimerase family protein [Neobacillus sp. YIM B06451]